MRTKNSVKNVIWVSIVTFVNIFVNFFSKKIFINMLGIEYNGLNSLFLSIISMLSIAELGIGTTIIYRLYKPISEGNTEEIKSLLNFYKRCYRIIAVVVLSVGVIIMPFLHTIVGSITINVNIYIVYLLFLTESVCSYLLSYKRSIFIGYQNQRVIKKVHLFNIVIQNSIQIILLFLFKNYYCFLIIKLLCTIGENAFISYFANKKYPYINGTAKPLDDITKKDMMLKIKAMLYHQIAGFVVNGTDNILISYIFGVAMVGYYNNYFLIISTLVTFINGLFSSITASVGNLLVTSNKEKNFDIFKKLYFINFLIATLTATLFLLIIQKFIIWWIGENNLLSLDLVIFLTLYYYLRIMKYTTTSFKDAAGIFYEDRFMPVIESVVNIIASLLFSSLFGISGIIMGTIASTLVLYIFSYPRFVFKKIFKKPIYEYYALIVKYFLLSSLFSIIIYFINGLFCFDNFILEFIKTLTVSIILFFFYVKLFFYRTMEFEYFKNMTDLFLKKIRRK